MADLVVDTGPLMEGFSAPEGTRCLVPEEVLAELDRHGVSDYEIASLGLVTARPSDRARSRVASAAQATGDHGVLSPADVALLALAVDLGAPLVTDDYAVQNVAASLGVEARPFGQRGIRATWQWVWVCKACWGHEGSEPGECPVCGSPLKRRRQQPG